MADPRRDLPRVINTAMRVAISGFFLMNIALFTVLPFQSMRDSSVVAVVRCVQPTSSPAQEAVLTCHQGLRPRNLGHPWRSYIFISSLCL